MLQMLIKRANRNRRSKYGTIPIPNSEVSLDGDCLEYVPIILVFKPLKTN